MYGGRIRGEEKMEIGSKERERERERIVGKEKKCECRKGGVLRENRDLTIN